MCVTPECGHVAMLYTQRDGEKMGGGEDTSILSNLSNVYSPEVVDRVSETQLQVGENSN